MFLNRQGQTVPADEALGPNGALRDGYRVHFAMNMLDAAPGAPRPITLRDNADRRTRDAANRRARDMVRDARYLPPLPAASAPAAPAQRSAPAMSAEAIRDAIRAARYE